MAAAGAHRFLIREALVLRTALSANLLGCGASAGRARIQDEDGSCAESGKRQLNVLT